MKARINKSGNLDIERAGKFKVQECIFENSSEWCGDHCPQFGEPRAYTYESKNVETGEPVYTTTFNLDLCQNKILMLECAVIDERES